MGEIDNESSIKCNKCGHEMQIGEWPMCPHGTIFERPAVQGEPTVVFFNPKTGKYRFPGSSSTATPDGYERQVLSTDRERAVFEKKLNAEESAKLRENWYARQAEKDAIMQKGVEKLRERYKDASPMERQYIDAAFSRMHKDQKRSEHEMPKDAGFQIRMRHWDQGRWDD